MTRQVNIFHKYRPILLVVLDGWGLSPSWGGNALTINNPKNIDYLWRTYPHKVLQAFSSITNDPTVIADSRLGHSMIAAGRPLLPEVSRINLQIQNRQFFHNRALIDAMNSAKRNQANLHLIGLISDGGIHSHIKHLISLIQMAAEQNFDKLFVHAITDGTDTRPTES